MFRQNAGITCQKRCYLSDLILFPHEIANSYLPQTKIQAVVNIKIDSYFYLSRQLCFKALIQKLILQLFHKHMVDRKMINRR